MEEQKKGRWKAGPGNANGRGPHGLDRNSTATPIPNHGQAEVLLSRLEGVRAAGPDRWAAKCPAHDDSSPSLSIRQGNGRVLFHCHAQCSPDAVIEAVGLRWIDLFADEAQAPYGAAVSHAAAMTAKKYAPRMVAGIDLAIERMVLRIFAADVEAGKSVSSDDLARAELAKARLESLGEFAHE